MFFFKSKPRTREPITLTTGNHSVRVTFLARSKSLRLRVDQLKRQVAVSAPLTISVAKIQTFLDQHLSWITQEMTKFENRHPLNELTIHGISYTLNTVFRAGRAKIVWDDLSHTIHYEGPEIRLKATLLKHLSPRARDIACAYSQHFAQQLGVTFKTLKIGEYKSRWGACTRHGDLSFSWRLILAPPEVFQYVCAHEVAHLVHHNHSKAFWGTVMTLDPGHAKQRLWLKKHGTRLYTHL